MTRPRADRPDADDLAALIAAVTMAIHAEDRLLSVTEAAQTLGIGRSTAWLEVGTGRLRSLKVRGRRLVPTSAVKAYIAEATDGR